MGTSWVKIGSTRAGVAQRLKILQTGQPFPLQVLATVPVETDVQRIEHQVHAFLAEEQQRGEWFEVAMDAARLEALVVRAVQYVMAGEAGHEQRRYAKLQALLGLRIMTLLHRQQKSVYALAKQAGLPVKTVQRICKGEGKQPSVWTIAAIARVLGVSMDDLAGLPEAAPSSTRPREGAPEEQPPAKRPRSRKATPVGEDTDSHTGGRGDKAGWR
jgi:transcriptional regulator with XRE-family HTH domain